MAQGRYEGSRERNRDDDRHENQDRRGEYGREQQSTGYGKGRESGYDSDYGRGQGGGQRGYGQYARDEDERGGFGGDYGRWQQGDRYGRGYGKDRSEQFGADYGPRGRFRDQGYQQSSGSENWYGGDSMSGESMGGGGRNRPQDYYGSQTQSGGSYARNYNEMYGHGSQDSGGFGQRGQGSSQSSQNYGGQNFGSQGWGQHRGKGPKNYSRSDDRIREDVSDHLTDDAHLDASEIDVQVKDGEVTLSGTVDSREARRRAEDAIEHLSGIKHVQNNLRVKEQGGRNMDAETTSDERTGTAKSASLPSSPKTA